MTFAIQPVLVARGVNATALNAYIINDNVVNSATWFYQYGKITAPSTEFVGIDNQSGNLAMTGTDYTSWDGTAAAAQTWLCAKLTLTPAT